MVHGGFPVKSDREVSGSDQEKYNMVIVGGPDENALAAKYWDELPVRTSDQSIEIAGLKPLPRKDSVLGFLHYNPSATRRLILRYRLRSISRAPSRDTTHSSCTVFHPGRLAGIQKTLSRVHRHY